jgi:hypothetical protein
MGVEKLLREGLDTAPSDDDAAVGTATATRTGRVNVIHGVYAHSLPLAGMTVRQARAELEDRMNISPEAVGVVDGIEAEEESVLREGQVLNFLTPAGEKGLDIL